MAIYFIQAGKNGPIKIGQTDNGVEQRIAQLQTGCPYELKLLWLYTDFHYTESEIHAMFSHERIRGEWFHPSSKIFKFISEDLENSITVSGDNGCPAVDICEHFEAKSENKLILQIYRGNIVLCGDKISVHVFDGRPVEIVDYIREKTFKPNSEE